MKEAEKKQPEAKPDPKPEPPEDDAPVQDDQPFDAKSKDDDPKAPSTFDLQFPKAT